MNNKKLNNKGITLAELIVSFVIVAVAVIYFYQMLVSITKMYVNAREGTNHAAKVNYVFRLLDEAYKTNPDNPCGKVKDIIKSEVESFSSCDIENGTFDKIRFKVDSKTYTLYKYSE